MCDAHKVYISLSVIPRLYSEHVWQSINRPDLVANPARGQLNRKFSLSPFAPENLVSRDGSGRPVPCQPAHSPHSG